MSDQGFDTSAFADQEAKQRAEGRGLRYNKGKIRYDLVPPDGIRALAQVYTKGALKYEDRNWEKGMPWMDCYASLTRHAQAWHEGETYDPETKLHHMAHVAWNAIALVVYFIRGIGEDNRPSFTQVNSVEFED